MRLYEYLEDLWVWPQWLEGVSCSTKTRRVFGTRRTMCASASLLESRRGCGVTVSFPELGSVRPVAGGQTHERVTRHNAEISDQRRR